jgi:hypothetical protein
MKPAGEYWNGFKKTSLTIADRMKATFGAGANISDNTPILTIDLPVEQRLMRLNTVTLTPGLKAGEGAGVVISVASRLYVGYTAEVMDLSEEQMRHGGPVKAGKLAEMVYIKEALAERFVVKTALDLVKRLQVMMEDRRPGTTLTMPQLGFRTCAAADEWEELGFSQQDLA